MSYTNIIGLLGGLAMFIFGMNLMGDGLKQMSGSYLKKILEKLTSNKVVAMGVGAGLTALIQSSNAMCVMVVGFVNAGMMQLERSIGILMGAKIGTTITGQLIAFNISDIAPLIAFIGVVITMFCKKKQYKCFGQIIASLGVLFIGLGTMSESMKPLRDVVWFRDILQSLSNPLLAVLVGFIFTVIIQSASASVGILQVMAGSQVIGFEHAFFVMIGMNIGASVAPAIASIGGRKDAKRVAFIVALFESLGMLLFLLIYKFIPVLSWIEATAADPSRQIANANTIFNCVTVAVLLPFSNYLGKISRMVIRGEDKDPEKSEQELRFISESGYNSPTILIEQIDAEVKRMQNIVKNNLVIATTTFNKKKKSDKKQFDEREETIDFLNKAITDALIKMSSMELTDEEAKHAGNLFHVVCDLERIGDHSENMVAYANRLIENNEVFTKTAFEELNNLINMIYEIFDKACKHLYDPDQYTYDQIYQLEEHIDEIVDDMKVQHVTRLNDMVCSSEQGLIFVETLTDLERVADHCLNIAQSAKVRYHHTVKTIEEQTVTAE